MRCPRCKMNDVYLSSSGNANVFSFLTKSARCHRCCYLFKVSRWSKVPDKSAATQFEVSEKIRRAA